MIGAGSLKINVPRFAVLFKLSSPTSTPIPMMESTIA
jgi:hypothetical protein